MTVAVCRSLENVLDEQIPKFEDFEWTNCGGKFPPPVNLGVPMEETKLLTFVRSKSSVWSAQVSSRVYLSCAVHTLFRLDTL